MNAYNELYLNDAKSSLGQMFSYLIDDCNYSPNRTWEMFRTSGYDELFERGDPGVISGMSGIELGESIIRKTLNLDAPYRVSSSGYLGNGLAEYSSKYDEHDAIKPPKKAYNLDKSPAYWAGWALAEYQWITGRRFREIMRSVSLEEIVGMYRVYHEMDISQFIDAMEEKLAERSAARETNLKRIREARGLSQSELAELTGVGLRSIQMYEQRQNDIDKAQGQALFKLSRALGVSIEDILESPSL